MTTLKVHKSKPFPGEYSAFFPPKYLAYDENNVKLCLSQSFLQQTSAPSVTVSTPGAGLPL